jgi:hypothetical protein
LNPRPSDYRTVPVIQPYMASGLRGHMHQRFLLRTVSHRFALFRAVSRTKCRPESNVTVVPPAFAIGSSVASPRPLPCRRGTGHLLPASVRPCGDRILHAGQEFAADCHARCSSVQIVSFQRVSRTPCGHRSTPLHCTPSELTMAIVWRQQFCLGELIQSFGL